MATDLNTLIAKWKEELDSLPGTFERTPRLRDEQHPRISDELLNRMLSGSPRELASIIDHTLLKPEAQPEDIVRLCVAARENRFYSVCVNPVYVPLAVENLSGTNIKVAAVAAFPLGATSPEALSSEVKYSVEAGASEIDMVIPVGLLKAGEYNAVYDHIRAAVEAAGSAIVKVIIETCLLTQEEKIKACLIALKADAEFVKTSTGFSTGGATVEDVELMRAVVGEHAGVKASGGVRTAETARAMIKAGANRIGASASVAIVGG